MLEPELVALAHTVNASGAMLQTITRLGAGLDAFNANAAPIAELSRALYVPAEQSYPGPVERTWIPAIRLPETHTVEPPGASAAHRTAMPAVPRPGTSASDTPATPPAYWPTVSRMRRPAATAMYRSEAPAVYRPDTSVAYPLDPHDASGSVIRSNETTSPSRSPEKPTPNRETPSSQPMSRHIVMTTPSDGPLSARATPLAAYSPGTATAPAASLTAESPSSSPISMEALPIAAPADPEASRSAPPDVDVLPLVKARPSVAQRNGPPRETQVQALVVGAMAPRGLSQAAHDVPPGHVAGLSEGGSVHSVRLVGARPYATAEATEQPMETLGRSVHAESAQTESEPRQGMLVLDGAQLGRWMIDHLEHRASRPGAMTTGIDPRMSAEYPGASTGV